MIDNQVTPTQCKVYKWTFKAFSYLYNALKGLMTLLVGSTLGQVPPDPHILAQENLTVLLQPIKHLDRENKLIKFRLKYFTNLLDILLEEPEGETLVQLDLLGVPLALQLAVVSQDLVDHRQHVAGALLR